jgi:hypothetical protein
MRIERWWNPNLPQMLGIAVFLLYFNGLFGALSLLGIFNSPTPYLYFGLSRAPGVADLIEIAAVLGFIAAGLLISNSQRLGWTLGAGLAVGAVLIPFLAFDGLGFLTDRYLFTWMFDIALAALLLHPQSRQYQKIWFS